MRRASDPMAPSLTALAPVTPLRRGSLAPSGLTSETIVEEVNHWQKIRDIVTLQRKLNLNDLEGGLGGGGGARGGGRGGEAGGEESQQRDMKDGLDDLKAVAEELERLKSGEFGAYFREQSVVSLGKSVNNAFGVVQGVRKFTSCFHDVRRPYDF